MRKIFLIVFIVSCLFQGAYSQNISAMDEYCYPQMNPYTNALFELMKKSDVEYVSSEIEIENEKGEIKRTLSIWPKEETSLIRSRIIGPRNLETIALCSPLGYYTDRSDFPRPGGKKIGEQPLMRVFGTPPATYQDELKYLSCVNPSFLDDVLDIYAAPSGKGPSLDRHLFKEKVEEFKSFVSTPQKGTVNQTFEFESIKISLTKTGLFIDELKLWAPGMSTAVRNTFARSQDDPNYRKFESEKYFYDIFPLDEQKSFGFTFTEKDGEFYINFDQEWSRYLYGAPKVAHLSKAGIVSVNGKDIKKYDVKELAGILSSNIESLDVVFEKDGEFTFKKFPYEVFYCLGIMTQHAPSDIFWEKLPELSK